MKVKVSLTGGTGYIGSHTVAELIEVDHEVRILRTERLGKPKLMCWVKRKHM